MPHAQTSAPARLISPAVNSHFAETVGGAEAWLVGTRFAAARDGAGSRSFLEGFDLLIFTCLQLEAQDYANWAAALTAKQAERNGRYHVRLCADLFSGRFACD